MAQKVAMNRKTEEILGRLNMVCRFCFVDFYGECDTIEDFDLVIAAYSSYNDNLAWRLGLQVIPPTRYIPPLMLTDHAAWQPRQVEIDRRDLRLSFELVRMFAKKMNANPCVFKRLRILGYRIVTSVIVFVAFVGCDRDPMVRVYDAPKELVSSPPLASPKAAEPMRFLIAVIPEGQSAFFIKGADSPERLDSLSEPLRQIAAGFKLDEDKKPVWSLPEDWKVLPGNEIAMAFLEAPAEETPVRFSVTALTLNQSWDSYLEMNINRWRRQLGLPENSFAEQKPDLVEVKREKASLPAYLLDLSGVASSQSPRMGGGPPPNAPSPVQKTSPPRTPSVSYVTPDGWNDVGASGMREASFKISSEKSDGEVTVVFAGGDRLSNVERWQGQLNPEGAAEVNKASTAQAIENAIKVQSAKGIEGQLYTLLGPEGDAQTAMLAAILPAGQGDSSLFVKLTGSAELAEENRDKLIAFISSLEW
jgi:hypothetical protein